MKKDNELSVQTKVLIWITIIIAIISILYCGYLLYNVLSKKEAKEPTAPTKPVVEVKNPLDKIEDFYGYQELKDVFEFKATEKEVPTCYEVVGSIFSIGNEEAELYQVCLENDQLVVKNDKNMIVKKLVSIDDAKSFIMSGDDYEQNYFILKNNGDLYAMAGVGYVCDDDFIASKLYKIASEVEKMTWYYRWDEDLFYKNGQPHVIAINPDKDEEDSCFTHYCVSQWDISSTAFEDKRDGIATGFALEFAITLDKKLHSFRLNDFDSPLLDEDKKPIIAKTLFTNMEANYVGMVENMERYSTMSDYENPLNKDGYNVYVITQNQELYKFSITDNNSKVSGVKITDKKIASYKFTGGGGKIVELGASADELTQALVIKETGSMEITYTDGTTETITGINFRI